MNFQQLLLAIQQFWAGRGCVVQQPYDLEIGAGTMHPDTFFRVLGPEPWRVAFCQPSRRPVDGRFAQNPMRVYKHFQFQVILKPAPLDVQEQYLDSLRSFGVDPLEHDIRFEEDNWESPTLGAAGVGWQVVMDGMEISQFTYFQQAGGQELAPISVELTYGIERICMYLNDIRNVFDIPWNDELSYGDVRRFEEIEHSEYSFNGAPVQLFREQFDQWAGLLQRYGRCKACPAMPADVMGSEEQHVVEQSHGADQTVRLPLSGDGICPAAGELLDFLADTLDL